MALRALNCPNCGGAFNPTQFRCEYCGSYVIMSKDNYVDLSKINFDITKREDNKHPGIYVFGRLLGKGEKPNMLGVANYFTGLFSAGGKLLLTNQSLLFSAHSINIGRKETKIALDSIIDVEVGANFFVSQQIIISTGEGSHKFVVYHGKEWVNKIKETMTHIGADADYEESILTASTDYSVELRKLKSLFDDGIITQEEYVIKKRNIIGI